MPRDEHGEFETLPATRENVRRECRRLHLECDELAQIDHIVVGVEEFPEDAARLGEFMQIFSRDIAVEWDPTVGFLYVHVKMLRGDTV